MNGDVLVVGFWRRGWVRDKIDCLITMENRYRPNPRRARLVFEPYEEGALIEESFTIDTKMAQEIVDDFWSLGIRPSQGTGSAGSLKATEYHLEDMRKLVFEEKNER